LSLIKFGLSFIQKIVKVKLALFRMKSNIHYFFHPKSVAVIGASDKEYSWGHWVGKNLLEYKAQGNVYVINPKHDTVLGEKSYKEIRDLPEDIDLAVVINPAPQVVSTLEECAKKGAKVATIISAGFGETVEGKKYREGLKKVVRDYGIRLQGPNCAGFYNMSAPINSSPLDTRFLKESPVAFVTQSGYVGNSLTVWGSARNLDMGKYISVGNEADLSVVEYIDYFSTDPTTEVIMVYIEGLRDGERFREVVRDAIPKKPIIVWKASETTAVRRAALSHTAHLTGAEGIFRGLMSQIGVYQLRKLEYGLLVCHGLLRYPPLQGNRMAVLMMGAGWGIILTDSLTNAGFEVPEFSNDLKQKLKELLPSYRVSVKNPIDWGAANSMDFGILKKIAQGVFESGEVDGFIIANIGDLAPFQEEASVLEVQLAKTLLRVQRKSQKPIYLFTPLSELDSTSVSIIKKKMNMYHTTDSLLETLRAQLFFHQKKKA